MVHTIGHEATAVIVTWPLIVALTPLGWLEALVADIGLALTYALYGYFFHLGFDRLRPFVSTQSTMATAAATAGRCIGDTPLPAAALRRNVA